MAKYLSKEEAASLGLEEEPSSTGYLSPDEVKMLGLEDKKLIEEPGFLSRVNEALVKRGVNIAEELKPKGQESLTDTLRGSTALRRALHTTGEAAGFLGDVASEGIKSAYTTLVPEGAQNIMKEAVQHVISKPENQAFFRGVERESGRFKQAYPETTKDIKAVANIGGLVVGGKYAKKVGESVKPATELVKATGAALKSPKSFEKDIVKTVTHGIQKGIRPGVAGKSTAPQVKNYFRNAQDAVENIITNKAALKFTDETGEEVIGSLPKNLSQFGQAIHQTKAQLFKQYDDIAKQAGRAGAEVDITKVSDELMGIANNKVLKKFAPGAVQYAEERAAAVAGKYTTEEAQEALKILNNSLEAFYKNPTYDTASKAYIDGLIANNMRRSLDNVITTATGKEYQALKSSYGSLKSIEKDVGRRAIVDARRNTKGLIDFFDILSSGQAVAGIMSMNPYLIGQAAAQKSLISLYKYLNDPNRVIKSMFTNTEKFMTRRELAKARRQAAAQAWRTTTRGE